MKNTSRISSLLKPLPMLNTNTQNPLPVHTTTPTATSRRTSFLLQISRADVLALYLQYAVPKMPILFLLNQRMLAHNNTIRRQIHHLLSTPSMMCILLYRTHTTKPTAPQILAASTPTRQCLASQALLSRAPVSIRAHPKCAPA